MKIKVSELEGEALDHMVQCAEGFTFVKDIESIPGAEAQWAASEACRRGWWRRSPTGVWACCTCQVDDQPSRVWDHGGPIIDREQIRLNWEDDGRCWAEVRIHGVIPRRAYTTSYDKAIIGVGPTALVAAMRAFVASRFGPEVTLPDRNRV